MSDPCMPEPTDEHRLLQRNVGVWDVAGKIWMFPDQPPIEFTATDTVTAVGPFWIAAHFDSRLPTGEPGFSGVAQSGFDPAKGRFVSTWIGTIQPAMDLFEGTYDPAARVLRMESVGAGGGPYGPSTRFRSEEESISADERVFRMWASADGVPEHQIVEYRYRRRA